VPPLGDGIDRHCPGVCPFFQPFGRHDVDRTVFSCRAPFTPSVEAQAFLEFRFEPVLLENEALVPIVGKTMGQKEKKMVYARGGSATTRNVDTPRFDGFSIGSNDLTQLVLGVDRDSEKLADLFDEKNEAVRRSIRHLIEAAHEAGRKVGICGQAPSDHPDFAAFLVEAGIDSISLNPDSVIAVKRKVAETESRGSG
jgi:phosphoenolpyruvate synthase/pyruvate phosphate dikinase